MLSIMPLCFNIVDDKSVKNSFTFKSDVCLAFIKNQGRVGDLSVATAQNPIVIQKLRVRCVVTFFSSIWVLVWYMTHAMPL